MEKHVVFVCVENSCRSQMAEALAHRYCTQNNVSGFNIYSAGSAPSGVVNPKAIESMAYLDYDLTSHDSKSLDDIPDVEYDAVITMGCGDNCPWVRSKRREDWGLPDPKHLPQDEFNQIRDQIAERIEQLMSEL